MRLNFRLVLVGSLLALGACGKTERSAIALEVTGDLGNGAATISCTSSTSGTCHVLFLAGDISKAASAPVGNSTTVTGLIPGVGFCSDTVAPVAGKCKPTVLVNGRQIVRRETKVTRD
ncbi:hypothetical protein QH494_22990 [Sphingomonas sp. AR_OL41]|uniref:hypothetical protein n=1 Tax=Sphingomonas sp. AR_OL41 TaxID=3042729 RepID=UPI0024814AF5|nr:hypothetical protein [Sphingomonas sp. AR_OL41]MDH7975060.1 hypothetical protein [Sphingomonas sp. AR_OL41]